ncbi:hypothetical protein P9139_00280 [Curtobacterium flaccumfaciens]|nr:hypothetical protein P9139_00280 [Curtobacterium flaccumfaciens]
MRALQALFAGYAVAPLADAVREADLVMSATGVPDTIDLGVLRACADAAVVAVAGGVDQEVAVHDAIADGAARTTIGRKVERLTWADGHHVLLLDDGGCINITAAEGNPVEIMDLSFAAQLGAVRMLLERGDELDRAVVPIDPAVDEATARAALAAFGSRPVPLPTGTAGLPLARQPGTGGVGPGQPAAQSADREPDVRTRRFGGSA